MSQNAGGKKSRLFAAPSPMPNTQAKPNAWVQRNASKADAPTPLPIKQASQLGQAQPPAFFTRQEQQAGPQPQAQAAPQVQPERPAAGPQGQQGAPQARSQISQLLASAERQQAQPGQRPFPMAGGNQDVAPLAPGEVPKILGIVRTAIKDNLYYLRPMFARRFYAFAPYYFPNYYPTYQSLPADCQMNVDRLAQLQPILRELDDELTAAEDEKRGAVINKGYIDAIQEAITVADRCRTHMYFQQTQYPHAFTYPTYGVYPVPGGVA